MSKNILGISAFYHDSAAALISGGDIIAAAQEERFSRKKSDADFPEKSIEFCLQKAGLKAADIDYVVFYEKPFLKFERLLETYVDYSPRGFASFRKAIPIWLTNKLFQKNGMVRFFEEIDPSTSWSEKILFSEHHLSHAASAFYPSPFQNALVLTLDGVGEHATTSVSIGRGNDLKIAKEIHFPHSVGLLYSAFTYYLGFKVNSGEYKVMGLAPYGNPKYRNTILSNLVEIHSDGSFHLNMDYFDYCVGLKMTNQKFERLFGVDRRNADDPLTQVHMDIAASIQVVTEEIILNLARATSKEFGEKNLCLAGGVALNCVANGMLLKSGLFENIWIQPAPGDAGGAIGAAFAAYHLHLKAPRSVEKSDKMKGSFLGPEFTASEVEEYLISVGANFHVLSEENLLDKVVDLLVQGKVIGWHQGRMEFGPRALGARSILADPRNVEMQKNLNLKIKYRESFRPFAPIVLREHLANWFDIEVDSPYMQFVAQVNGNHRTSLDYSKGSDANRKDINAVRSAIPAVTHVDFSARIQTVYKETNRLLYRLLENFYHKTNVPVLVNTSFNIRGEPIVCTPRDSFQCFMGTEMDVLVLQNCLLLKSEQPSSLFNNYKDSVLPD